MATAYELSKFREILKNARRIVALTGAGISAESGVPTFRGSGGLWRQYRAQQLATPAAFNSNPALIWQFYAYRRELVLSKQPNAAHYALARAEQQLRLRNNGRLTVITQNIDELHKAAGSSRVIELHGTLFKTRCVRCGDVSENRDSPITESLSKVDVQDTLQAPPPLPELTVSQLPTCKRSGCGGLLRPHVVWFGESLEPGILEQCQKELEKCDLCLVVCVCGLTVSESELFFRR